MLNTSRNYPPDKCERWLSTYPILYLYWESEVECVECVLGHSVLLHFTSTIATDRTTLPRLTALNRRDRVIMVAESTIRCIRSDVLLSEQSPRWNRAALFRVIWSVWSTPTVVAAKRDGQTAHTCDDYQSTANPRFRGCTSITVESENFVRIMLNSRYFRDIHAVF